MSHVFGISPNSRRIISYMFQHSTLDAGNFHKDTFCIERFLYIAPTVLGYISMRSLQITNGVKTTPYLLRWSAVNDQLSVAMGINSE